MKVKWNEATGNWWLYDENDEPLSSSEVPHRMIFGILEKGLKYDELDEKYQRLLNKDKLEE